MLHKRQVGFVYCWVFTGKTSAASAYPTRATVNRPSTQGLHSSFWDSPNGVRNSQDQTHHFAGYFQFGADVGDAGFLVNRALWRTGDISWIGKTVLNAGDVNL